MAHKQIETQPDQEIEELRNQNFQLLAENNDLKNRQRQLDQTLKEMEEKTKLAEREQVEFFYELERLKGLKDFLEDKVKALETEKKQREKSEVEVSLSLDEEKSGPEIDDEDDDWEKIDEDKASHDNIDHEILHRARSKSIPIKVVEGVVEKVGVVGGAIGGSLDQYYSYVGKKSSSFQESSSGGTPSYGHLLWKSFSSILPPISSVKTKGSVLLSPNQILNEELLPPANYGRYLVEVPSEGTSALMEQITTDPQFPNKLDDFQASMILYRLIEFSSNPTVLQMIPFIGVVRQDTQVHGFYPHQLLAQPVSNLNESSGRSTSFSENESPMNSSRSTARGPGGGGSSSSSVSSSVSSSSSSSPVQSGSVRTFNNPNSPFTTTTNLSSPTITPMGSASSVSSTSSGIGPRLNSISPISYYWVLRYNRTRSMSLTEFLHYRRENMIYLSGIEVQVLFCYLLDCLYFLHSADVAHRSLSTDSIRIRPALLQDAVREIITQSSPTSTTRSPPDLLTIVEWKNICCTRDNLHRATFWQNTFGPNSFLSYFPPELLLGQQPTSPFSSSTLRSSSSSSLSSSTRSSTSSSAPLMNQIDWKSFDVWSVSVIFSQLITCSPQPLWSSNDSFQTLYKLLSLLRNTVSCAPILPPSLSLSSSSTSTPSIPPSLPPSMGSSLSKSDWSIATSKGGHNIGSSFVYRSSSGSICIRFFDPYEGFFQTVSPSIFFSLSPLTPIGPLSASRSHQISSSEEQTNCSTGVGDFLAFDSSLDSSSEDLSLGSSLNHELVETFNLWSLTNLTPNSSSSSSPSSSSSTQSTPSTSPPSSTPGNGSISSTLVPPSLSSPVEYSSAERETRRRNIEFCLSLLLCLDPTTRPSVESLVEIYSSTILLVSGTRSISTSASPSTDNLSASVSFSMSPTVSASTSHSLPIASLSLSQPTTTPASSTPTKTVGVVVNEGMNLRRLISCSRFPSNYVNRLTLSYLPEWKQQFLDH